MGKFSQIISKLNEDYRATANTGTGEAYSKLSTILGELDIYLREYLQDLTGDDVKKVIKKLKSGDAIAPPDLDLIRLWLVGDADYYVQHENDFNNWSKELARLIDHTRNYDVDNPDVATVARLRSIFRDASRVIADIMYFVQQKDRVSKFDESTQEIDDEERAILVRLLDQKLKSKEF
jgi:hypothetical protein